MRVKDLSDKQMKVEDTLKIKTDFDYTFKMEKRMEDFCSYQDLHQLRDRLEPSF